MSDEPQYDTIQWFFPTATLPRGGQVVTWIDLRGRQIDGTYHGSLLWIPNKGGYTIGSDKVVAWRVSK